MCGLLSISSYPNTDASKGAGHTPRTRTQALAAHWGVTIDGQLMINEEGSNQAYVCWLIMLNSVRIRRNCLFSNLTAA